MSRAVCRNCWTWYSKGETVCPHCHVPLTAADLGAPGFTAGGPSPDPGRPSAPAALAQPSTSGTSGLSWLFIGGGALAVLVVIGLLVTGLALTGVLGPVTSSDGRMSVKVPKGWAQSKALPPGSANAKPVLGLARLEKTNGVESHFIVEDFGQFVPLRSFEEGWQLLVDSGESPVVGNFGPLTRTAVAGAPALTVDYQGSKFGGQLMFVDYGSKTYLIEMSSDPSEFAKLRDSDFAAILSSWQWH